MIEAGPNGFLNREPQTLALDRGAGPDGSRWSKRGPRPAAASSSAAAGCAGCPTARRRCSPRRRCRGGASCACWPSRSRRGPRTPTKSVYAFAARRHRRAKPPTCSSTPAVAGITAGDSRRLSVAAQFPRLAEMERDHGSLLRAMFAAAEPPRAPPGPSELLSFDDGHGRADRRPGQPAGPVAAAERRRARALDWTGRWLAGVAERRRRRSTADHVVLAVPARRAAPMVEPLDAALAGALAAVEYAGLAVVALGYRAADVPRPLDGYGYLATRRRAAGDARAWSGNRRCSRAARRRARCCCGSCSAVPRRPEWSDGSDGRGAGVARAELRAGARRRGRAAVTRRVPLAAGDRAVHARATAQRRDRRRTHASAAHAGLASAARPTTACRSTTP